MNSGERTKLNILLVLIGLVSVSVFFQRAGKMQATPESSVSAPKQASRASADSVDQLPSTFLLTRQPPVFGNVKRNIFQFSEDQPLTGKEKDTHPINEAEVEQQPVMPEVRYLGFYLEKQPPLVKLAAISNGGKIYVGKVGDVLGGRYEILQIEDESLTLRLVQENRVIRFPLGRGNGGPVELTVPSFTPPEKPAKSRPRRQARRTSLRSSHQQ